MNADNNINKEVARLIRKRFGAKEGERIPLHAPTFAGNEKRYLEECIDTTFVSSVGAFVDRFEKEIAEYTGAKRAVVCVNGTNAIYICLLLAGVKAGDEVLTQSLSFIATCNAIKYTGASPVFIDVDKDTMGMSPESLRNWLKINTVKDAVGTLRNKTTGAKIAACVPMHTFGHPCRIEEIASICKEYGIELIEDAAESLGSTYKGKHTGTFGKMGAISFNGNKTITTGGGGMILLQDDELADKAKHLTTQAKLPSRWEFIHDEIGYNYRMPNINAALGCAQLEQIDGFLKSKRKTAETYREFFQSKPGGVQFMVEPEGCKSNYWLNAIAFPDKGARDSFLEYSNANGIMTRPAWELMTRLPMFEDCQRDAQENSEWLADRIVNIPSSVIIES